jgi:hypothetical protein
VGVDETVEELTGVEVRVEVKVKVPAGVEVFDKV